MTALKYFFFTKLTNSELSGIKKTKLSPKTKQNKCNINEDKGEKQTNKVLRITDVIDFYDFLEMYVNNRYRLHYLWGIIEIMSHYITVD